MLTAKEGLGGMGFPPATAGFAIGSRVGGYVLEEQIGHGGMAVVFRALDENLGRRVALKILAPALAADVVFRQRFIRESRSAAAVDDPHIIPLFEAGESDGVLFIAMRYVQGGDVRSLLARRGALDPDRVAAIVAQVASALDTAHAAGLVHRDVKPANMLLDMRPGQPDHVYLSDFGLSKEAAGSVGLTGAGLFLGTVDYAAPEQIDGRQPDGRTDQYALACAAFEMLCGQPPFVRDQSLAVLHAHLSTPPPPVSTFRAGVPGVVDSVLGRALGKSPEHRYRTCGEFSDALRDALAPAPYDARFPWPGRPQTELAGPAANPAAVGVDHTAWPPAPVTPAWPVQPGQVPDQAGRAIRGSGRRRTARWPFILIGAAAVAAVAVAISIVIASQTGGTPIAGRSSTPAVSTSPSLTPTPAPTPSLLPGWTTYQDASGFSVQLPPGWAVDSATRTGTYPGVDFTGPAQGFHLFVSWTAKTGTRALPAWQRQASSFARKDPTYQQLQLQQVSYRSYNSALWEFTNSHDGALTHVLDLDFVVKPGIQAYAIELYGPQSDWPAIYGSMWNQVLASFQPAH
jgi:Protein kinase domain